MLCLKFICMLLILHSLDAKEVVKRHHHKDSTHHKKKEIDYCSLKCGSHHHIACNNDGKPGPHCQPNVKVLPLKSVEHLILSLHNEKRNEVAGGNHHKLPPATRMAHMQWCDELAHLAELKALQCTPHTRDQCFSTSKFEHPGQINALLEYVNETDKFTLSALVENRIKHWFSESHLCQPEHIKSHNKHSTDRICDISLTMIDKNTHIGCGAVHTEHKPHNYFHMVCNYAHRNHHGKPVYKTGNTASDCETGKDKHFQNLCSTKEKYD